MQARGVHTVLQPERSVSLRPTTRSQVAGLPTHDTIASALPIRMFAVSKGAFVADDRPRFDEIPMGTERVIDDTHDDAANVLLNMRGKEMGAMNSKCEKSSFSVFSTPESRPKRPHDDCNSHDLPFHFKASKARKTVHADTSAAKAVPVALPLVKAMPIVYPPPLLPTISPDIAPIENFYGEICKRLAPASAHACMHKGCNKVFGSPDAARKHYRLKHLGHKMGEISLQCKLCPDHPKNPIYHSEDALRRHARVKHPRFYENLGRGQITSMGK